MLNPDDYLDMDLDIKPRIQGAKCHRRKSRVSSTKSPKLAMPIITESTVADMIIGKSWLSQDTAMSENFLATKQVIQNKYRVHSAIKATSNTSVTGCNGSKVQKPKKNLTSLIILMHTSKRSYLEEPKVLIEKNVSVENELDCAESDLFTTHRNPILVKQKKIKGSRTVCRKKDNFSSEIYEYYKNSDDYEEDLFDEEC